MIPIGAARAGVLNAPTGGIPDEGDLFSRYDFSEEDGAIPVTDQTGNGNDLTGGSYTGVTTSINGVQSGEFNGVDDYARVDWAEIQQPLTFFIVYQADTDPDRLWTGYDTSPTLEQLFSGGEWVISTGGDTITGGTSDLQPHISSVLVDGTGSIHRIDGVEVASGDLGSNGLAGITLGARGSDSGVGFFSDVNIGEVLIYPSDKSGKWSAVESYLSNKWGITI